MSKESIEGNQENPLELSGTNLIKDETGEYGIISTREETFKE